MRSTRYPVRFYNAHAKITADGIQFFVNKLNLFIY